MLMPPRGRRRIASPRHQMTMASPRSSRRDMRSLVARAFLHAYLAIVASVAVDVLGAGGGVVDGAVVADAWDDSCGEGDCDCGGDGVAWVEGSGVGDGDVAGGEPVVGDRLGDGLVGGGGAGCPGVGGGDDAGGVGCGVA